MSQRDDFERYERETRALPADAQERVWARVAQSTTRARPQRALRMAFAFSALAAVAAVAMFWPRPLAHVEKQGATFWAQGAAEVTEAEGGENLRLSKGTLAVSTWAAPGVTVQAGAHVIVSSSAALFAIRVAGEAVTVDVREGAVLVDGVSVTRRWPAAAAPLEFETPRSAASAPRGSVAQAARTENVVEDVKDVGPASAERGPVAGLVLREGLSSNEDRLRAPGSADLAPASKNPRAVSSTRDDVMRPATGGERAPGRPSQAHEKTTSVASEPAHRWAVGSSATRQANEAAAASDTRAMAPAPPVASGVHVAATPLESTVPATGGLQASDTSSRRGSGPEASNAVEAARLPRGDEVLAQRAPQTLPANDGVDARLSGGAAPSAGDAAATVEKTGPSRPPAAAPAHSSALREEAVLLQRAETQLRVKSDPGAALRTLDEAAARFPSGSLQQEVDLTRIEALRSLERWADLKEAAAAFTRRFPHSERRAEVEALATFARQQLEKL